MFSSRSPSPKSTKSLSVRDNHSSATALTVLTFLSGSLLDGDGRVLSLLPLVHLNLRQACFHVMHLEPAHPGWLSQPLEFKAPESDSSRTFPMAAGAREATAPSPVSIAVCRSWPRCGHSGSFFPRRLFYIPQNVSHPKSLQLEVPDWATALAAALPGEPRLPAPVCPADRQALAHSHTHWGTHSPTLSVTLSWIFEGIALQFSCKTGLGLGARGWSFQLLHTHVRSCCLTFLQLLVASCMCADKGSIPQL